MKLTFSDFPRLRSRRRDWEEVVARSILAILGELRLIVDGVREDGLKCLPILQKKTRARCGVSRLSAQ